MNRIENCLSFLMPHLKPPISLYQTALHSVRESVLSSCLLIQQRFGTYDKLDCQIAAKELQNYLVDNICGHIIDILCNTTKITFHHDIDFRILFSVYLHNNMRIFCPQIKVNLGDEFWQCKFQTMENLIILDLNCFCTDGILEVVGNHCKKLEFINIVSKVERISCSFNALKLKYFVSDLGLQSISKCKNLQVIIMPKVIRSQSSGFKITHNGIMYVLQSLPKLKLITYSDLGSVIRNNVETELKLSLTSIMDYHCENLNAPLIIKACPHLTEFHLCFQLCDITPKVHDIISKTMQVLAVSDIKLTSLSIRLLSFCDTFKCFLAKKGTYIKTISLIIESEFYEMDVIYLGETCPKIKQIFLFAMCKFSYSAPLYRYKNLFSKLNILILKMVTFSTNILALFLKNANSIKQIVLNTRTPDSMDRVLDDLMVCNSFLELEEIHLGALRTFENIMKFINFCPVLKTIKLNDDLDCVENICKLNQNLKCKNINTEIILVKHNFYGNPFIFINNPFIW